MYMKNFIYYIFLNLSLIKMAIKSKENTLGAWAFLVGVVLAILIGIVSASLISIPVLTKYSTAIYAILVIVSKFGMDGITGSLIGINVGKVVTQVFGALLALFVPATIIVALKTVFGIAKV